MKISIAMATFNGGNFLRQQLQSFLAQTRLRVPLLLPKRIVGRVDGTTLVALARKS